MHHKRFVVFVVTGCALVFTAGSVFAASTSSARKDTRASSPGVQHALQQIAEYSHSVTAFTAPGPSIKATGLKGKTVWYIPIIYDIPIFHTLADAMTAALGHAGVNVHVCNGNGNPVDWGKCITQAVQSGAAGIVIDSIQPNLMSVPLASAKAAHIPVVLASLGFPHGTDQVAYASYDYPLAGRLMADLVIADSNGKATVLIGETTDSSNTALTIGAAQQELKTYCPGCKANVVGVTDAEWSTRLQPVTSSAILRDPSTNYVIPEYDGMTPFMFQGIQTAGSGSNIKVYTFNADLQQMQAMRQHQQDIYGDVGVNSVEAGWGYADQILRLMLGQTPAQHESAPTRIFTRSNSAGLALTNGAFSSGAWYGDTGYTTGFLKLWGLG